MQTSRWSRSALCLALAIAFVVSACSGDDSSKPSQGTTTAPAGAVKDTTLGPGVTANSVKLGFLLIDTACIAKFVDFQRTQQVKLTQLFVDHANRQGGVNGRRIVPVYKTYCPITGSAALAACTSLTEDSKVFAAVGTLVDFSGDAQLCFTNQHKTPLITIELTQAQIAKATPGLLLSPDITPERRVKVIMALLASQGTLDGKTVAVLADANAKPEVSSAIDPALKRLGVKRGTDALLTVSGADTTAAMSQLSSFIERWKTEHVDAVVLAGSTVVAKPFVQAVRNAFPDITMVADTTDVLSQAQDEAKANVDPNPYDGIITAEGDTGKVHQTRRGGKYCRAIYEKATGKTYPDPNAVYPGKGGKREDLYDETEGACSQVVLFSEIAKRAGKNLNATTWADAVNHFGKLFVTSTLYASLHQGKYDADDTYGLVAYDPSVGAVGDWKRVTPVQDVGNVSP